MAVVTVRAFGALRELVGSTTEVEATSLSDVLAQLRSRHGAEFDRRMARANVVVDDVVVGPDDDPDLSPGAAVVLLPPFAGG